jgi:hypothetical protein
VNQTEQYFGNILSIFVFMLSPHLPQIMLSRKCLHCFRRGRCASCNIFTRSFDATIQNRPTDLKIRGNNSMRIRIYGGTFGVTRTTPVFNKVCKSLMGHTVVHPAFKWLWDSPCQLKHKVFFRLLLKDRINRRGMLKRRNMHLDSYTCELCLWRREETLRHVFIRCNFAKACWQQIGILVSQSQPFEATIATLSRGLLVPFYMDIYNHNVLEHLGDKK